MKRLLATVFTALLMLSGCGSVPSDDGSSSTGTPSQDEVNSDWEVKQRPDGHEMACALNTDGSIGDCDWERVIAGKQLDKFR